MGLFLSALANFLLGIFGFVVIVAVVSNIVNYLPNKIKEMVREEFERQKACTERGLQFAQEKDLEKCRQKKLVEENNRFEIEELKRQSSWLLSPIEENPAIVHGVVPGQTGSGMNSTFASQLQFNENPPEYLEEKDQRHELRLAKEKDRQSLIARKKHYRYEVECLKKQGNWLLTEEEEKAEVD